MDILQNKAPIFITGAVISTHIAAMQVQTEISDPSERHHYSALSLGPSVSLADSLLCNSVPMTGEHLFDCPSLHVRSQDN
ncbi:hypothetical protein TNCV_3435871 [Trichonephila clavipes]|nr:hypothetical protein TNCV_3435871 [Trichonephila clavipes]